MGEIPVRQPNEANSLLLITTDRRNIIGYRDDAEIHLEETVYDHIS